ncbi:hypothetical protein D3C74_184760 [compost metagenome]
MSATKTVHDLAAYLVSTLGPTETLKLQKLLYYCNAWSLALRNRPVFTDHIEAWKHGPVVSSIYPYHRRDASVSEWKWGNPEGLAPEDKEMADAILKLYGARSGWSLRNLTHDEAPWKDAWYNCGEGERFGEVISHEAMASFYSKKVQGNHA